ncbi:hypothetical protein F511_15761 [Dorcoceras hygrometricum]|uniref:Uncharacterized protein n=1 Tax=Dorcoceras hygrometricum TaxID=472368 RepID=A0A2Z7CTD6_9LAMI|nr:hypothetical protein F511_15761 [Dorcoceras hygrometricum]
MVGSQNPKADQEQIQLNNSGYGVCEYMGATHSSKHTAPDAKHSSTCCCPTQDVWELPTPLIVPNRSQQGDEVYGSYPLILNRHPAYTAAIIITHAQSKAVKQAHIRTSSLPSNNYNKAVPSNIDLTPAKPNTDSSSRIVAQKLRIGSYNLNQIFPTPLTQQKALSKAQASRKFPKVVSNEASQQEESNATTLTSIGTVYHRHSKKIRSHCHLMYKADFPLGSESPIRYGLMPKQILLTQTTSHKPTLASGHNTSLLETELLMRLESETQNGVAP